MKTLSLVLALTSAMMGLVFATVASAEPIHTQIGCNGCNDRYHPHGHEGHEGDGDLLNLLLSVITLQDISLTESQNGQQARLIYIQNVKDDAADFVAGGVETAELSEAIAKLRMVAGVSGTDEEIAARLIAE
jgi:hypothetical protein